MARPPKLYNKLVRRRGGLGTHSSLWLAADHVLLVEGNFFSERYQRVFLRDVQGLFVRPSRQLKWVVIVGLALIVLFGGLMTVSGEAVPIFGTFLGITVIVLLLYGLFLGRTCHFHVVTAVQRAEWPNVARYGQARKLIARISPLIHEAQAGGALDVSPTPVPQADVSTQA